MKAEFRYTIDPIKKCAEIDRSVRNKLIRIAMNKAASPVKAAVIQNAPSLRGNLKKSIRIKLKNYNKGLNWVAIIGASRKFKRKARRGGPDIFPAKYARLVEEGSAHNTARPYLKPALSQTSGIYVDRLCQSIEEQLKTILH